MKLVIAGILAALVLTGCSSQPATTGQSPLDVKDAKPAQQSSRDLCALMPGPEVAKAIGVQVTESKRDPDISLNNGSCVYTGMTECQQVEENARELCRIRLVYEANAWSETLGERSDEAVSGVGEEAHYQESLGLFVKIGAKDRLQVVISLVFDRQTELRKTTDLAKAVVAKL
jgi:hypothetical protein